MVKFRLIFTQGGVGGVQLLVDEPSWLDWRCFGKSLEVEVVQEEEDNEDIGFSHCDTWL